MGKRAIYTAVIELAIETTVGTPLYRKIYRAILDMILSGALGPGSRLPSTRLLADQLKISRNTVWHAYEQLLSEGYLESKAGSGNYVSRQLPECASRRRRLYQRQSANLRVTDLIANSGFPMKRVELADSEENHFYIFNTSIT